MRALVTGHDPESSPVGIALAIASLLIMPFLSWARRRTGRRLGSAAVVADSTQTLLCTYLSAVLLAGLLLNASLGWSWADPIAGLVIAAVAVKEGREAWRGEGCCAPGAHATTSANDAHTDQANGCGVHGRLCGRLLRVVVRRWHPPHLAAARAIAGHETARMPRPASGGARTSAVSAAHCAATADVSGRGRPGTGDVQIRRCDAPLKSRTVPVANSACGEAR